MAANTLLGLVASKQQLPLDQNSFCSNGSITLIATERACNLLPECSLHYSNYSVHSCLFPSNDEAVKPQELPATDRAHLLAQPPSARTRAVRVPLGQRGPAHPGHSPLLQVTTAVRWLVLLMF